MYLFSQTTEARYPDLLFQPDDLLKSLFRHSGVTKGGIKQQTNKKCSRKMEMWFEIPILWFHLLPWHDNLEPATIP
jgi:hypothetical protein